MSKVLITGANGFIGSKLLEKFSFNNFDVQGWDIFSIPENKKNIKIVNMRNKESVLTALEDYKPNIIIHCAGNADVGKSIKNPEEDYYGNVTLTHNLLFSMHKLCMRNTRFVFLSSAAVYGNPIFLPIVEDMQINPLSPYALHKVMCESICEYFASNYSMDIKIARTFSAYGKGLHKQIFWDMYNKIQTHNHLTMFGTGNESRDYIHVNDVVQALYLLATVKSNVKVFNVANGEEITIRQAAEWFAHFAGIKNEDIEFTGYVREGDPLNWRADISRLKKLGYEKTVDMIDGLGEYYEWVNHI